MLKKIFINNKKVPVPVPIFTLGEALRWIESTLVPAGHTITRVVLDDRVLGEDEDDPSQARVAETRLGEATKLEVQIDSPVDLAIQTLDAMRNLAAVVLGGLKPLAVDCWQSRPTVKPAELDATAGDLELVLDLIAHVTTLTEPMTIDASAVQAIAGMVKRVGASLAMARGNSDWKACAKILLNKLEPLLKDLVTEGESLQIRVMAQAHALPTPIPAPRAKLPTG